MAVSSSIAYVGAGMPDAHSSTAAAEESSVRHEPDSGHENGGGGKADQPT